MKKTIAFLFFFVLTATAVFAENQPIIRIKAETTVESDLVHLGNIAQIQGETEKIERLKTVSLGYAPNVGLLREISRRQILLSLSAAGFTENEIVLDSPEKILIRRAGQTISQDQFHVVIENFLTNKFASDQIAARILRLDLPADLLVPKGTVEIRPNFSSVQNFFQPFSVPVEIRVDGKVFRRLSATIEVEAFADVLVAVKDLPVNLKIAESDVRLENRRVTKPITNYLRENDLLRGLMIIKPISGGTEITSDSFAASVVVKNGDTVRIEAESGRIKIVISGEARSSGKIGDRIAVKNLQSGSILQATVVAEGLVKVLL